MISVLDRYIGRRLLIGAAIVTGIMVSLMTMVVLIDGLRDFGKGEFGLSSLIEYVVLSQPRRLYEVFPVVALVGTLLGLSTLAVHSELTALRAAGISIARIVRAALKTGLLLVLAVTVLGEVIVPATESRALEGRAKAMATGLQTRASGLWLRDGHDFVNLGEVLPSRLMLRVSLYKFLDVPLPCAAGPGKCGRDRRLQAMLYAERASLERHQWRLEGVRLSRLHEGAITTENHDTLVWPSKLTPDVISAFSVRSEALSLVQLHQYIQHLGRHGQETARYRLAFWQRLFLPLAVGVMVLLAAPFAFRHVRSGGVAGRLFLGVLLGLGFLIANRSFGYLGLIYGVPPWLGATLPIAAFFLLSLWLLRRAG